MHPVICDSPRNQKLAHHLIFHLLVNISPHIVIASPAAPRPSSLLRLLQLSYVLQSFLWLLLPILAFTLQHTTRTRTIAFVLLNISQLFGSLCLSFVLIPSPTMLAYRPFCLYALLEFLLLGLYQITGSAPDLVSVTGPLYCIITLQSMCHLGAICVHNYNRAESPFLMGPATPHRSSEGVGGDGRLTLGDKEGPTSPIKEVDRASLIVKKYKTTEEEDDARAALLEELIGPGTPKVRAQ